MAVRVCFENLTRTFGDVRAVDDVSLTIEPGELFFLLGPSGCGKTTLLRCMAGFCEPDRGRILVGDRDITRLPPHRRDTGMVFQSYALWPHMTVRENVAFGLQMRSLSKSEVAERVAEVLETVHMTEKAATRPNELSGGQQQRVALARALVIRPQCLLLDEPLSNLDAKLRLEMRAEIRRICKQAGLTAVYVTHDQKEALSIADRLAVLDRGRVQQVGAPADVYRRPASEFVASFIGETNFLHGSVASSDRDRLVVETPIGSLTAEPGRTLALSVGDRATVSLRPEAVRLGEAPAGSPNVFPVLVRNTVYLGEVAQHEVVLSRGEPVVQLKAFELNPRIMARDSEAEASMWIAPIDVVVLPAGTDT